MLSYSSSRHGTTVWWAALTSLGVSSACSGKISDTAGLGATGGGAAPSVAGSGGLGAGGVDVGDAGVIVAAGGSGGFGGGPVIHLGGQGGEESGGQAGDGAGQAGDGDVCATVNTAAELDPVYLAFAFDVSGSMGALDLPWYDPQLKWEPAVQATRSFFEDDASAGLFASLTSFPIDSDDEAERCDATRYEEPDVPMTKLPSSTFGERLQAIRDEYWGSGTPTRVALDGVMRFVDGYRLHHPGSYAVVLVTDGYPQGCDDANTLETVEAAVHAAADEVPTYVIGVKNPPFVDADGNLAPDTVSDLHSVAEAGGTDAAFIIDTGDPEQTRADFRKAVEGIRTATIACDLDVPMPPDGRRFEKDHVVVSTTDDGTTKALEYDENCKAEAAWHYDSATKPTRVVLCPSTCADLQNASTAKLRVGFTCKPVIDVR